HIAQQVAQLGQQYNADGEKRAKDEERMKIQEQAYNSGFADAGKQAQGPEDYNDLPSSDESFTEGSQPSLEDDLISEMENLEDDELMMLAEQNPDLLKMLGQG
ncbi:MAG: hypothetical protein ACI4BI_06595, partial [Anaerotardibacter sp.]